MFNYSFEFYFAKNSFNIQYFGKKFIRILFRKKILRLFIGFTTSRFTRNILLIEICHAKFFNFRIKIIFRDKILYQFNKFNQGPIIELFPVHFNFLLIDRQVQFFHILSYLKGHPSYSNTFYFAKWNWLMIHSSALKLTAKLST